MKHPDARHAVFLALAVTVVLLLSFGFNAPIARQHSGSTPVTVNVGSVELAAAEGSLRSGGGPAEGVPVACATVASFSVLCGDNVPAATPFPAAATWSNLTLLQGTNPGPWVEGGMTWDASDGYVLLWGGAYGTISSAAGQNNTWSFSNGVWDNLTASISGGHPAGNLLPGLAYDPASGVVVEFGGLDSAHSTLVDSTWTYHDKVWTNITASAGTAPSPRDGSAMAADTTDHELVLFGGDATNGYLPDTWTYHDGSWTNVTATSGMTSTVAIYPALATDPTNHGVLLIFITNGTTKYTEATWVFAAGTWTNLTGSLTSSPALGLYPTLEWSAQTSSVLMTAGIQVYPNNGTELIAPAMWAFYAGAWVDLTSTPGLPASSALAGASAAGDGSVVLYGGAYLGTATSFTNWLEAFALPPNVTSVTATPSALDVGMSSNFTAVTSGGIGPVGLNFSFGDSTNHSGTTTAEHQYTAAGTFHVTFTARDFIGRSSSASTSVTVNPDLSVSSIDATGTNVTTGTQVTFSVTATGGTNPLTYAWNFGDGTTSTAASPVHNWTSANPYSVTVTVTDAAGAHVTKSVVISVSSPSTSAFSLTSGTGLYILILLVVVVVVVVAVLALRMKKKPAPSGAPTTWTPPPSDAPPPPAGAPPPPPGAGGPPPGAV